MNFSDETLLQASPGNLSSELEDETVILNVDRGVYYGMNPVAAFVWSKLENPQTFGEVRESIMAEFDVDDSTCRRDLAALLTNLVDAGLVAVKKRAA